MESAVKLGGSIQYPLFQAAARERPLFRIRGTTSDDETLQNLKEA